MLEEVCVEAGSCARWLAGSWMHAVHEIGQLAGAGFSQLLEFCAPMIARRLQPLLRLHLSAHQKARACVLQGSHLPSRVLLTVTRAWQMCEPWQARRRYLGRCLCRWQARRWQRKFTWQMSEPLTGLEMVALLHPGTGRPVAGQRMGPSLHPGTGRGCHCASLMLVVRLMHMS